MLSSEQIDAIGWKVAKDIFPPGTILQVSSRSDEAWDGDAIIRVLFVLQDARVADVTGDRATRALSELDDSLMSAGDLRRGTIDYVTAGELAEEKAEHGGS